MNNLNAIIFEGKLLENPRIIGDGIVSMKVESFRYIKRDGERSELRIVIICEVDPKEADPARKNLADRCMEYLEAGSQIRIVGHVRGDLEHHFISAEHIEFQRKPKMEED